MQCKPDTSPKPKIFAKHPKLERVSLDAGVGPGVGIRFAD
jgi:hypothetical protein